MASIPEVQGKIQAVLQTYQSSAQGSIRRCSEYLIKLHSLLSSIEDPSGCLRQLYAVKQLLHGQINHRILTRQLAELMIEVERITLFSVDIIKSSGGQITRPVHHLEFRFDWRELCGYLDSKPLYITDYGSIELIRSLCLEQQDPGVLQSRC